MPRYKTINRWYNRQTGQYVDPPTEVELDKTTGQLLVLAGCTEPATNAAETADGEIESNKPGPPTPKTKSNKRSAGKKTAPAGG